jgi:hypothetical protein
MWSIGGAVLLEVVVCAGAIVLAARRVRGELEPTRRSCESLHVEVTRAVRLVARDTGRAEASRRLLLRRGKAPTPR